MEGFKKLADFVEGRTGKLLTVRTTEAHLKKEKKEGKKVKTLWIKLKKNSEVMTDSKERELHLDSISQEWLEEQLRKFEDPEITEIRIADNEHPLEVITGDVSLRLKIEGKKYYLLFYRDIPPKGWLVSGGCPRNLEEVLNPLITATREGCEEICILDKKGTIYSLCSSEKEWKTNHQNWLESRKIIPKKIVQLIPKKLLSEKGIAQNLVIIIDGKEIKTENVNVNIDTQTASASVTLYWEVSLPIKISELMIFDGEKEGKINRPIGLFTEEEIKNDEPPDVIFVSGQNILSVGWCTLGIKERATIS